MAAFQFPDPAVQTTVINPITGSTYQWKEPPGKWVVTVKMRDVGDIIWEGDKGPDPVGDYKLWYHTEELELYFYYCDVNSRCDWVPTSAPITMLEDLQADVKAALSIANSASSAADANLTTISLLDKALNTVENSLGQVTLQEVLNNSNIADKDIVLTDGADDLIDISITEGRIAIASDTDVKAPKLTLAHKGEHVDGNRKADIELDEDGTRLDFEMSAHVKDVHFRFENDEKFILNHEGDAEFLGKVKVEPGTSENEVVTYQQLVEVEEELEDLRPSIERGNWEFKPNSPPTTGYYTLLKVPTTADCTTEYVDCIANAGSDQSEVTACNRRYDECNTLAENETPEYATNWIATLVYLNIIDSNTETHTFTDAEPGEYLEVSNEDGSGFALYEIEKVQTNMSGKTYFTVKHVRSKGLPGGKAKVKVFEMTTADPSAYVRKEGDTMDGELKIRRKDNPGCLHLRGDGTGTIFYTSDEDNTTVFRIKGDGKVQAGTDASRPFIATQNNDITTKKYVDDKFAASTVPGSPYVFTNKHKDDLKPGEMMMEDTVVHVSITDANGVSHYPSNDRTTWEGPWYVLKVYDSSGQKVIIHTGVKVYGKGKDGYLAWAVTSSLRNNNLTVGSTYYVADGLFLSY